MCFPLCIKLSLHHFVVPLPLGKGGWVSATFHLLDKLKFEPSAGMKFIPSHNFRNNLLIFTYNYSIIT